MKALHKMMASILLFGGGLVIGSVIISSAAGLSTPDQPGGSDDPLVTKSYVDQQIQAAIDGGYTGGEAPAPTEQEEPWEIVELSPEQTLMGEIGTELIVRNGKTIIISESVDGIADVTAGVDLVDGDQITNNHLLINPGEDRGIRPEKSITGTIFVMVNGDYRIVE